MPRYLKRDAVRLLGAGTECLGVALLSLGMPVAKAGYLLGKSYVSATGLLGVTVELALSACLVQGYDIRALEKTPGKFKSAAEVLDDFKALVREGKVNAAFLVAGVASPEDHQKRLLDAAGNLKRLALLRAGALHGGVGLGRDACLIEAHRVADFLDLLAESDRIRPYLPEVPRPPEKPVNQNVLLDDIVRQVRPGPKPSAVVASIVVLLPGLPTEQPDWFDALAKGITAPRDLNVSLLLSSINAMPTTLHKSGGPHSTMSVRVEPGNPAAVPVRPEDLKSELSQLRERWAASRGVANGHLKGRTRVALPSQEDIREAFTVGLDASMILSPDAMFGPHEAWPFVASSLEVQGTPGPYWFILRRTNDLAQTRALLQQVALRNSWRPGRLDEALGGIEALLTRSTYEVPRDIAQWKELAEASREKLSSKLKGHGKDGKGLPSELETLVASVARGETPVGEALDAVLSIELGLGAKRYWARMLCESASEAEDLPALSSILAAKDLDAAHTAAKKALRWTDYATHGPAILATST